MKLMLIDVESDHPGYLFEGPCVESPSPMPRSSLLRNDELDELEAKPHDVIEYARDKSANGSWLSLRTYALVLARAELKDGEGDSRNFLLMLCAASPAELEAKSFEEMAAEAIEEVREALLRCNTEDYESQLRRQALEGLLTKLKG